MLEELLYILYEKSFRYDPECGFVLSSGKKSDIYIDAKKTLLTPRGLLLTGRVFFERLKDEPIEGIGGLTMGADPIAYATSLVSTVEGKPLGVFIVRKEPKKHGTKRSVESALPEGAPVVVVDDVVTTGASTIKAIERAREEGLNVVGALALVDREEGGRENIEKHCPFDAIFKRKDFIELWKKKG